jgi:hypothetical protein
MGFATVHRQFVVDSRPGALGVRGALYLCRRANGQEIGDPPAIESTFTIQSPREQADDRPIPIDISFRDPPESSPLGFIERGKRSGEAIVAIRSSESDGTEPARRSDPAGDRRDVETLLSDFLRESKGRPLFAMPAAVVCDLDLGNLITESPRDNAMAALVKARQPSRLGITHQTNGFR